ncbi:hypothetical protein vseg_008144 [Gypsophila vaccaria]
MAIEVAMEDDMLFADLNRQISLLIDDEDDNDVHVSRVSSFSTQQGRRAILTLAGFEDKSYDLQGFQRRMNYLPKLLSQNELYQANCVGEKSKGTGVFIPQSTHPRRRYRQHQAKPPAITSSQSPISNKNKQITSFIWSSNVAPHANLSFSYNGY